MNIENLIILGILGRWKYYFDCVAILCKCNVFLRQSDGWHSQ